MKKCVVQLCQKEPTCKPLFYIKYTRKEMSTVAYL